MYENSLMLCYRLLRCRHCKESCSCATVAEFTKASFTSTRALFMSIPSMTFNRAKTISELLQELHRIAVNCRSVSPNVSPNVSPADLRFTIQHPPMKFILIKDALRIWMVDQINGGGVLHGFLYEIRRSNTRPDELNSKFWCNR